jgi:sulfate adenylyltransferase subunit 1
MDLVDWDQETYERIRNEYKGFASKLDVKDVHFIPISALTGDNVVTRSEKMNWYDGPTLLYLLETIHIGSDQNHIDCRFPVQYVIRPQKTEFHDYRGFGGRIAGGVFKKGDRVMALPSGFTSTIKSIDTFEGPVDEAFAPMSVSITLQDEIDISRGDMIVKENNVPRSEQDFDIMICWMNEKKLTPRGKYILRHTSKECRCLIKEVKYKMNINTLHRNEEDTEIGLNDIGRISIRTTAPLFVDSYRRNRYTGSVILVDENTFETVGAGMII